MEEGQRGCRSPSQNVCHRLDSKEIVTDENVLKYRTGLPLSTYFSAVKLRWMIDHYPEVFKAHEEDNLLFGTVESWVAYVRFEYDLKTHLIGNHRY